MQIFNWTDKSADRNKLTEKYEPVQPLILYEILSFVGATKFVDVGANVGYYSVLMSQLPKCEEILSFEANSDAFSQLLDNVSINGLNNKVNCVQKAVSNSNTPLQFQIAGELSGINSVASTSIHNKDLFTTTITVEACTIDSFSFADEAAIGLKIDVEGHEIEVLQGARGTLERNKCILQIETYEGSVDRTRDVLERMTYRKIFSAGNDYYYTNIPALFDPRAVLNLIEAAMARTIEFKLGKWPKPSHLPKVHVQANLQSDRLTALCTMEGQSIGSSLEFAFYVIANGQRIHTRWYEPEANLVFDIPADHQNKEIIVRGFARDALHPSRKIIGKADAKKIDSIAR